MARKRQTPQRSKSAGVNTHVQIDQEAKEVLDGLPWGTRRRIMSALVMAFAKLDKQSSGLASHAILSDRFRLEMGLTEDAQKDIDDARGDGEVTGPSGKLHRDESEREGKPGSRNKGKARKDAA